MGTPELNIITSILEELGLQHKVLRNRSRDRIRIYDGNLPPNVFFNIPLNQNFVFQLIFENGNDDRDLRDQIADELGYQGEGGEGLMNYLTIYLPEKRHIPIHERNKSLIANIIEREMETVRQVL